ncbi:hypothetical protein [Microbulbifer sp. SAOS-129_SWC]|uniref:hypothetical protein n=1 Tax=Microbulbifer sp. SAOS-129_SWC TaxID=3145235 RepID=UPI0032173D43
MRIGHACYGLEAVVRHLSAFLVALFTPYLIAMLFIGGFKGMSSALTPNLLSIFAIPITLFHLIFYVPIAVILDKAGKFNLFSAAVLGFLIACTFFGIQDWPYPDGQYVGHVDASFWGKKVIKSKDGFPTFWGWVLYFQKVLLVGALFGAPTGFAYGLVKGKA